MGASQWSQLEILTDETRKYHLPDFSHGKNHAAFEAAFARLEKDLRTRLGKKIRLIPLGFFLCVSAWFESALPRFPSLKRRTSVIARVG